MEAARKELYRNGIKTSYNDQVMIFSNVNNLRNSHTIFMQESNGLILELNTWRPLVVPPRSLRCNIDTDASNKFLHQGLYHIYKAIDGTCFNMYYLGGKWIISTARGHTMNGTTWNGTNSYQEIISECLDTIGLTWDDFTSRLDTTRCYSFGFRHPYMHAFTSRSADSSHRLWFIQSVCTNEEDPHYLWASDQSPIAIIPTQELYQTTVGNFRELYKKASSALEDYLATGEVCFGFILRSVNTAVTTQHSDLLVESSLMRAIRKIWYENSLIDTCHTNGWDKTTAITLSAYLSAGKYEHFTLLFPQYAGHIAKYNAFISNVVKAMTDRDMGVANDNVELRPLVDIFLHLFKDEVRFDPRGQTREFITRMYMDFVCRETSLDTLMGYSNLFDKYSTATAVEAIPDTEEKKAE